MPLGISKTSRSDDEAADDARTGNGTETVTADDDVATEEGASTTESPSSEAQPADEGQYRRMSFRPDYLDDVPARQQASAPAARAPHGDAFFVTVTRGDTPEVHRFEGAIEAQTFVESLLEDGVSQEDVSAFSGRRLAFSVSHRPVVKLAGHED